MNRRLVAPALPVPSPRTAPAARLTGPAFVARVVARVRDPRTLSPADIAAWEALEARAAEPNAYLSPHFLALTLAFLHAHPEAAWVATSFEQDRGDGHPIALPHSSLREYATFAR